MMWLKWSMGAWNPTCLLLLRQALRQFPKTSGLQSTQLKTTGFFWGKASSFLPLYLLFDSNWQTHLLLTPLFPATCSLTGFPKSALNELYGWRNVWLCTNIRNRDKKEEVLTEEALLNVRVHEGSVCWSERRHHKQRDTHTDMPVHKCTPTCTRTCNPAYTCVHPQKRKALWKKQFKWNEYLRALPTSLSYPEKKKKTRAVLLKF